MISLIMSILGTFGSALGAGASWLLSLFIKHQQDAAQAEADMNQSIQQHAQDGQEAVAISDSADQQLERIKAQQEQLNQPQAPAQPGGK